MTIQKECQTCRQGIVTSVSWTRYSHEDMAEAEQKSYAVGYDRGYEDGLRHAAKQVGYGVIQ